MSFRASNNERNDYAILYCAIVYHSIAVLQCEYVFDDGFCNVAEKNRARSETALFGALGVWRSWRRGSSFLMNRYFGLIRDVLVVETKCM